jgi:uncharacterized DUF497 family protein
MHFELNEEKRRRNIEKHGIDFEDAVYVFASNAIIMSDTRANYGEDRKIAVGYVDQGLLVVVFTDRGDIRRLISARRGGRRDHERYKAYFT